MVDPVRLAMLLKKELSVGFSGRHAAQKIMA
jgi:hypothetical protein